MAEDSDDLLAGLSDLIAKGGIDHPQAKSATEETIDADYAISTSSIEKPEMAQKAIPDDEPFNVRLERAERAVNGLVDCSD